MKTSAVLLTLVLALGLASMAEAQNPLGGWENGRSTWYQGIDSGNCMFGGISSTKFPFRNIAAPNQAFYANSAACGQCFEVKCVNSNYMSNACYGGSVIIQVTDSCPCDSNPEWCCGDMPHFDLSPEAFSAIANTMAGVINTQFRPVTCPVSGSMRIRVKEGSNPWWLAIMPQNVGGTGEVTKVEVSSSNSGSYMNLQRQQYNYWIGTAGGSGLGFPLGVRVWQGSRMLSGTIPNANSGAVFDLGAGNF